jgi:hypothetical protein
MTFSRWTESGTEYVERVSLEDCDFAVLPFDFCLTIPAWDQNPTPERKQRSAQADAFIARARGAGKRVLLHDISDLHFRLPRDGSVVVMTASVYRSKGWTHVRPVPAWGCDMLLRYSSDTWIPVPKYSQARVAFCGAVYLPPLGLSPWRTARWWLRSFLARQGLLPAETPNFDHLRRQAIEMLRVDPRIASSFIPRFQQWEENRRDGRPDWAVKIVQHAEYGVNMMDAPYHLCAKGFENYSYRFYEALSCGRIPVFVDSDMVLPGEDRIDWDRLLVRVAESEIESIADRLVSHHERITESDFKQKQNEILNVWREHLRPERFYPELLRTLVSGG